MQLNQFPKAIAEVQVSLVPKQQNVRRLKAAIAAYDREIEGAVAFDSELKNETQRKFKKAELQTDEGYQSLLLELMEAEFTQTEAEIELELLRNSFSVAKLDRRWAIAQMELQVP